jgi:hypothetical protein
VNDGVAELKENRHEVTSERSKANWSKVAARSGTSRTGLIFAALNGMKGWSVKKKKLFERSEFFFFSGDLLWSSGEYAALTFCFFWVKPKEKDSLKVQNSSKNTRNFTFYFVNLLQNKITLYGGK